MWIIRLALKRLFTFVVAALLLVLVTPFLNLHDLITSGIVERKAELNVSIFLHLARHKLSTLPRVRVSWSGRIIVTPHRTDPNLTIQGQIAALC